MISRGNICIPALFTANPLHLYVRRRRWRNQGVHLDQDYVARAGTTPLGRGLILFDYGYVLGPYRVLFDDDEMLFRLSFVLLKFLPQVMGLPLIGILFHLEGY